MQPNERARQDTPITSRPIDPRAFGLVKATYGVRETLDLLSIGRTSLYKAIARGDIEPVKLGKKTLFRAADLAAFVAALQRSA
jgi:excisionase family DNA binding protein